VLGQVLRNSPSLDWVVAVVPAAVGAAGWAANVAGFVVLPASAGSGW
jgi:hypothetical protein